MENQDYKLEQHDGGWAYVIDSRRSPIFASREAAIDAAKDDTKPAPTDKPKGSDSPEEVDRPGFDLGGSTDETQAGKGLGLGTDAKNNRKGWGALR